MHLWVSAKSTGELAEDAEMLILVATEDQIGGTVESGGREV